MKFQGMNADGDTIQYTMDELYSKLHNDNQGNNDSGISDDVRSTILGVLKGQYQYIAELMSKPKNVGDSAWSGYHGLPLALYNPPIKDTTDITSVASKMLLDEPPIHEKSDDDDVWFGYNTLDLHLYDMLQGKQTSKIQDIASCLLIDTPSNCNNDGLNLFTNKSINFLHDDEFASLSSSLTKELITHVNASVGKYDTRTNTPITGDTIDIPFEYTSLYDCTNHTFHNMPDVIKFCNTHRIFMCDAFVISIGHKKKYTLICFVVNSK